MWLNLITLVLNSNKEKIKYIHMWVCIKYERKCESVKKWWGDNKNNPLVYFFYSVLKINTRFYADVNVKR